MMLQGDLGSMTMGLAGDGYQNELLDHWQDHYGFDGAQLDKARPLVKAYATAAKDILRRYDQLSEQGQRELSADEGARMDRDFLARQLRYERDLLAHLTDAQRKRLHDRMPTLLRFADSGGVSHRRISAGKQAFQFLDANSDRDTRDDSHFRR